MTGEFHPNTHREGQKSDFPLYSSLERRGQEEKFLTLDELEEQTHIFLDSFKTLIEQDTLPDTFFFLDKSARPLAFLVKQLWDDYYPDTPMPEIRFVNVGGSGSKVYDKESCPFNGDPEILRVTYGKHIQPAGRILLVDEYTCTGEALMTARKSFAQAFPEATISAQAAYSKLPNWYQNKDYLGVTEYTDTDYERKALEQLNGEFGTRYTDLWQFKQGRNIDLWSNTPDDNDGVDYEGISLEIRRRFREIVDEISGTIPYVKKGEHIQTYYREVEPSVRDKLISLIRRKQPERKMEPYQVNHFQEARQELKKIAEEIRDKYHRV